MKLKLDRKTDALHLCIAEEMIFETEMIVPDVLLDFNQQGQVIGMECLNLSKHLPSGSLEAFHYEVWLS